MNVWSYYIGPMGVRYRANHAKRLVEIDAGKRGWIKSAVSYSQFEADHKSYSLFCKLDCKPGCIATR